MAELRDAGALGFTDDGKPVVSAGMLRKALQYQRLCGGVVALHEEDPALSGDGVMHEGAVSARLGLAGIPSVSRVDDDRPRRRARALRGRARALPAPLLRRVGRGARSTPRTPARGSAARSTPHHLTLTDDVVRTLDSRFKMNPPLRTERDRRALDRRAQIGPDRLHRHRPRAARAATRRRSRSSRRRWGPPASRRRSRRCLHRARAARRARPRDRRRADERRRARCTTCRRRGSRSASPRTSASSISRRAGRSAPAATPAARPTAASTAARCAAASMLTVAAGAVAFRAADARRGRTLSSR